MRARLSLLWIPIRVPSVFHPWLKDLLLHCLKFCIGDRPPRHSLAKVDPLEGVFGNQSLLGRPVERPHDGCCHSTEHPGALPNRVGVEPAAQVVRLARSDLPKTMGFRESRRWCWEELGENGKTHSADSIATNFRRLRESLGIPKSLDKLRKTSATHIEAHREYGRYKTHFLGLSPRSIADRHYAAPSKELFDEILMWLGRKYRATASKIPVILAVLDGNFVCSYNVYY